ncbi:MAG: hypothetical protein HY813_01770 [Candidatus Portnoybacteria bacterium]|nr:hypothetical protein [Candidatus Portnoybacteria bacterium]
MKLKGNGQPMTSFEDINEDGFTDIIVHVITKELQLSPSDTQTTLEGKLFEETIIKVSDSMQIVP